MTGAGGNSCSSGFTAGSGACLPPCCNFLRGAVIMNARQGLDIEQRQRESVQERSRRVQVYKLRPDEDKCARQLMKVVIVIDLRRCNYTCRRDVNLWSVVWNNGSVSATKADFSIYAFIATLFPRQLPSIMGLLGF